MSSDDLIYDFSMDSGAQEAGKFIKKEYVYQVDNNNSSYSGGTLNFDLTGMTSQQKWYDWQNGYIMVPIVIGIANSGAAGNVGVQPGQANGISEYGFVAGLLNGHHNIFNSWQIQANGVTVAQSSAYSNMHVTYKLMTELSSQEVARYGRSIGFYKDTSGSCAYVPQAGVTNNITYTAAPITAACAVGVVNNLNCPATSTIISSAVLPNYGYNSGLLQRQLWNSFTPNLAVNSQSQIATTGKNTVVLNAAGTITNIFVMAIIRLKDISPYFKNLPLCRGVHHTMIFQLNQVQTNISYTFNAAGTTTLGAACAVGGGVNITQISVANQTIGSTNTNPLVVASGVGTSTTSTGNGASIVTGSAVPSGLNLFVSCLVGSGLSAITSAGTAPNATFSATNGTAHPTFSNCRVVVPTFEMDATVQAAYTAAGSVKRIKYDDLLSYQYTAGIAGNSGFNLPVSSGVIRPKQLVVMQMINQSANGGLNCNSLMSPFATSPCTLDPLDGGITNYQVQIGGQNVYPSPLTYNYQMFTQEILKLGLNGDYTPGLTSGLINQDEWEGAYTYLVTDLTKRQNPEDRVPQSIIISGVNNNALSCDLYCFVTYEKEIELDLLGGQITPM